MGCHQVPWLQVKGLNRAPWRPGRLSHAVPLPVSRSAASRFPRGALGRAGGRRFRPRLILPGSSCHRPRQGQLGLSPEPGAENRSTMVCCPTPGSSQLPAAALQPPRHPACVMNDRSGSKTCCIWEFPLLLKKVPALPGILSREGDVSTLGGNSSYGFGIRRGLGRWRSPDAPGKSRHRFAPFTPHPLAKPPPFPRVSSTSKRGRKSHLMQTKVV